MACSLYHCSWGRSKDQNVLCRRKKCVTTRFISSITNSQIWLNTNVVTWLYSITYTLTSLLSPTHHVEIVECMACSDNVVRAGLTPKYRDKETLCQMLTYNCRTAAENKFPHKKHPTAPHIRIYDPPTPEFAVGRISLPAGLTEFTLPPIPSKLCRDERMS